MVAKNKKNIKLEREYKKYFRFSPTVQFKYTDINDSLEQPSPISTNTGYASGSTKLEEPVIKS